MIYLDNPATSWPKPDSVIKAVTDFMLNYGANPGRAGHDMAIKSGEIVFDCREALNIFFGNQNPMNVVFMKNITEALNTLLIALLRSGDHVITSSMEHNSMMRPLRYLENQGVDITVVKCDEYGLLDADDVKQAIRKNTKIIALNHVSNVTGTIQPIRQIGEICRKNGILFLLDTAQSAGCLPVHMEDDFIDLLAFTGHKGLQGPMGTGGLIVGDRVKAGSIKPLIRGGTGSLSETEMQPDFLPDALESGTPNVPGIAGLLAGINWIEETGLMNIMKKEKELTEKLFRGLSEIEKLNCYSTKENCTAVISFTLENLNTSRIGFLLNDNYRILTRIGLLCAPSAHKTIGTFPDGTVRLGPGYNTTLEEIDYIVNAVHEIAENGSS